MLRCNKDFLVATQKTDRVIELHSSCTSAWDHALAMRTPERTAAWMAAIGSIVGALGLAAVSPWLLFAGFFFGLAGGLVVGMVPAFFPLGPTLRCLVTSVAALALSWAGTFYAGTMLPQGADLAVAGAAFAVLGPLAALVMGRQRHDKPLYLAIGAVLSVPVVLAGAWLA